jgi:hypothetical protein
VILTGYAHPEYAHSLAEFGSPRELPRCGGWILERQIPGFPYHDAMGCYPLFSCQDWSQLHADLEDLRNELVTLTLVTDPFGAFDVAYLHQCFDVVIHFKEHFVADLRLPLDEIISKHHQYYAQKAFRKTQVERCLDPALHLDEWLDLFSTLIGRHKIKGIRAFSRNAFAKQLSVPGMVIFKAISQGITIGLDLWYVQGEVAHGHLVACNPLGYKLRASYALKRHVLQYFSDKVRWIDLGGSTGVLVNKSTDGLSKFKKGWSTGTRSVYLCGCILNYDRYEEILRDKRITSTDYFPAYRKGEF